MTKLHDYRARCIYLENGTLQTKVEVYYSQPTSLTKMRLNCERIADQNGWWLLNVTRLSALSMAQKGSTKPNHYGEYTHDFS